MLILFLLSVVESKLQYPQGYYPFQESPAKIPPVVRKPPYLQTQIQCPGVGINTAKEEQTLDNLCGDLNKGYLPVNPTGQNILGVSYPFELIKNKTLEFFSKTLPILKADQTLPKVAKYQDSHILYNPTIFNSQPTAGVKFYSDSRQKRHVENLHQENAKKIQSAHQRRQKRNVEKTADADNEKELKIKSTREARHVSPEPRHETDNIVKARESRGWCDDSHGLFCLLFNALKGDEPDSADDRIGIDSDTKEGVSLINSLDEPMTPCPSAVEYVTPVFAKNYQGVWRYVVQIPYEGYFTQTVEVVKCLSTKCEFLEGSCLASPRWVSLLVAEIYYPDAYFPSDDQPISGRQSVEGNLPGLGYSNYLQKRSGQQTELSCDGQDELGCYQVRLYYDWFLIPGSCKCWKNDFFAQYTSK